MGLTHWWRARALGQNALRLEREMEEEMRFHMEMEAAYLVARGEAPAVARRRARIAFGGDERFKEDAREGRALRWLSDFRSDMVFALRSLRRSPAFTTVAVVALGIGIGANATVFALVDSVAFKQLPIKEPEKVLAVYATHGDVPLQHVSYPVFEEVRAQVSSFRDVAAFAEQSVSVTTNRVSNAVWGVYSSDNYFTLLGINAARGQLFRPADGRKRVAVISYAFWKRQFEGNPEIVGRSVTVDGAAFTVIGVAPKEFRGTRLLTYEPSIWLPLEIDGQVPPGVQSRPPAVRRASFNVLARLGDNVPIAQAQTEANEAARRISQTHPELLDDLRFTLLSNSAPINPWLTSRSRIELFGKLLVAGFCLVLLVACADVANLLLARMTVRRHEISIRLATGASGSRLFRQLLTESLVLASLGALAALPLAYIALKASVRLLPPLDFALPLQSSLDGRVLLFTLGVSALSAVAFGIAPLFQFWSGRLNPDEHSTARISGTSGARVRAALVVGQVAVSVVALVAAAFLSRGLSAARTIDLGFDVRNAIVFTVDPSLGAEHDAARIQEFYRLLETRLRAIDGVLSVTKTTSVPLDGDSRSIRTFSIDAGARASGVPADLFMVDENYFDTMGMSIVRGSSFSGSDTSDLEPVVVNGTLARRLWNGASPLGRVMTVGTRRGKRLKVVGVAASGMSRRLGDDPTPVLWRSVTSNPTSRLAVIVRTNGDTVRALSLAAGAVRSIDPNIPVIGLRTLGQRVELAYSAVENGAVAGMLFGILAAILAAAGLFGTLAYNVAQRTREIGIRRALGADGLDIVRLIAGTGMRLTLFGIAVGLAVILFIPRTMTVLLYGVSPRDPFLIAMAAGGFLLIAAVATLGPALKALRIEPVEALRTD